MLIDSTVTVAMQYITNCKRMSSFVFVFLIITILNVAIVGQENTSEICRPEISKNIHPICIIPRDIFYWNCGMASEGIVHFSELFAHLESPYENKASIFCHAHYPIEIVLNFRGKSLHDASLNFPEFERTVADITTPESYLYHIRVPYGFITRMNSDVKSFIVRRVNATWISTSFVNYNPGFKRQEEIERSQTLKSLISVTQELINLPCPIFDNGDGKYPDGIHRLQLDSNSTGGITQRNLFNMLLESHPFVPFDQEDFNRSTQLKEIQLKDAYYLNNIPVDNKRLLWDPVNGFRFNISNWRSKDYLGSYFCTTGWIQKMTLANNFTLIEFKGSLKKPEDDTVYVATITRTVNISFECISTNKITFQNSFDDSLLVLNNASISRVKSPDFLQSKIFHLVYHLNVSADTSKFNDTNPGIVDCIDIESQIPVRTWHLRVRDIRIQYSLDPDSTVVVPHTFPLWLKTDSVQARCSVVMDYDEKTSTDNIKYLTCRNVMECDMIQFCLHKNASCPNIVSREEHVGLEVYRSFKPPDNGILNCGQIFDWVPDLTVRYFKGYDGFIYPDWTEAPLPAIIQFETLGEAQKLYSKDWLTISCKGHVMLTGGLIQWTLKFNNNSWSHIQGLDNNKSDVVIKSERLLDGIKSTLHIYLTNTDVIGITCMVPVWNSDKWVNLSKALHVIEPRKPKIRTEENNKSFKIGSKDESISCEVLSDPESKLIWKRLGSNTTLNNTISHQVNFASLQFPEFSSNDVGDYECEASNIGGSDSKIFHVSIDEVTSSGWQYIVLAILLILLSIGVVVILWIRRNLQIARRADAETQIKESADRFMNGYEDEDSNVDKYPYNNEYEIPMENLTIDRSMVLGSGAFGVVYRGRMEGRSGTVAIKTLHNRETCDVEVFQALMSELKLLMFIGKHPNIVELVGAVTLRIHSGELYIVSEECALRSLQNFLRSRRHSVRLTSEKISSGGYEELINDDCKAEQEKELLENLMKWSHQIVDAMAFISAKNVIHADLATRNILLTAEHDAKITDFGLSRKLYHYVQYVKKGKEPLPWAWMSIEALQDLTFSSKSDVWSYGVVLWEMYSYGEVPFGGMNCDPGFVQKLKEGLRLEKPELATDSIFDTMKTCWSKEPRDRPDFLDLKIYLESIKQRLICSVSQDVNLESDEEKNLEIAKNV